MQLFCAQSGVCSLLELQLVLAANTYDYSKVGALNDALKDLLMEDTNSASDSGCHVSTMPPGVGSPAKPKGNQPGPPLPAPAAVAPPPSAPIQAAALPAKPALAAVVIVEQCQNQVGRLI